MKQSVRNSLKEVGLPIIQLEIMGKAYGFIVDTGSNVNLMSSQLRDELIHGITSAGKLSTLGVGGDSENEVFEIPYTIEGMTFSALFGTQHDTFQAFEKEYGLKVSGLLGTDFMIRHRANIDFSDSMVNLSGI